MTLPKSSFHPLCVMLLASLLTSCGNADQDAAADVPKAEVVVNGDKQSVVAPRAARPEFLPAPMHTVPVDVVHMGQRQALFGDLHVHTRYSFDAFAFGTLASPDDAYRYARGEAIKHPGGFDLQLDRPLDFYGVSDHAMFLGAVAEAADPESAFGQLPLSEPFHFLNRPENLNPESAGERGVRFSTFIPNTIRAIQSGELDPRLLERISRSAWRDTIDAAERFNDPGRFTTFIAYEYTTTTDERGNLHRNVIFRGDGEVPDVPFSRFHAQNPERLWDWMDGLRARGVDSLAIPHNSNGSNGAMFTFTDWNGHPIDAGYADQRTRNEPLVEITQIKGTSDTHPALSPNDEWADFEIMPYRVSTTLPSQPEGSYVRDAYGRGLLLEQRTGANPYKFGVIGSSDTHVAAGSYDESNFFSKIGLLDATPQQRGSLPLTPEAAGQRRDSSPASVKSIGGEDYVEGALRTWGASGLAGVWADENTRTSIFNALRRKETFATSGPRIRVRLFAGEYPDNLFELADWPERGYAGGVAMGGELHGRRAPPRFAVWAARDAQSAPLQRLQIIKVWTQAQESTEMVYDVACSDGLTVDSDTHRCPDNGARVDLTDCAISQTLGDAEMNAVWQDPEFDPSRSAMYYVRVLENPTCRWSTWDAVRAGRPPRPDLHATIQERAWTSPIWYQP